MYVSRKFLLFFCKWDEGTFSTLTQKFNDWNQQVRWFLRLYTFFHCGLKMRGHVGYSLFKEACFRIFWQNKNWNRSLWHLITSIAFLYRIFSVVLYRNFQSNSYEIFPEYFCIEFFQSGSVSNFSRAVLYQIFPERFCIEFFRAVLYRIFPERSCIEFFQSGPVSNFSRTVSNFSRLVRYCVFPERSCIKFFQSGPVSKFSRSFIEFFQTGPVSYFSRAVLYRFLPERFRIECPKQNLFRRELN